MEDEKKIQWKKNFILSTYSKYIPIKKYKAFQELIEDANPDVLNDMVNLELRDPKGLLTFSILLGGVARLMIGDIFLGIMKLIVHVSLVILVVSVMFLLLYVIMFGIWGATLSDEHMRFMNNVMNAGLLYMVWTIADINLINMKVRKKNYQKIYELLIKK